MPSLPPAAPVGGADRGRLTLSALNHHSSTNNLIHEYRKFKEA